MATFSAAEISMPGLITAQKASGNLRRRRISPQAGHALEILGHAIDYLADEYVERGGTFSWRDPELQAIRLLMELNREIYFECPELPSLPERLRSFFRLSRRAL